MQNLVIFGLTIPMKQILIGAAIMFIIGAIVGLNLATNK